MSVALGIPWLLLLLMFGLAAFSGLRLNRAAGTRRGRRALIHGIAILAVLCLLVVLVLLLMALLRSAGNHPTVWTPVPHVVEAPRAPQPATIPLDSPPVAASRHSRPLVERETPVAADSRTASAKQAQMAGVLRALGNALVKVAAESPQAEAAADWVAGAVPATASVPARPAWVDAPPKTTNGVYQVAVAVGPYESRLECERNLPDAVRPSVDFYVGELLGPKAVGRIELPNDYLRDHLIKEQWEEKREFTVTSSRKVPMTLLHTLLGFDSDVKQYLRQTWHEIVLVQRLRHVALLGGYVLLLLATFWAYLKLDLATQGRYRKRLSLAAAVVVALLALWASAWA